MASTALVFDRCAVAEPAQPPPANPAPADSAWPIYHGNSYAASAATAPLVDPDRVQRVNNPSRWPRVKVQVSPWTVLRAPERGGSQVLLSTPLPRMAKYRIDNRVLKRIHLLQLDRT